jgi:hypothetical protein
MMILVSTLLLIKEEASTAMNNPSSFLSFFVEAMLKQHEFVDKVTIRYFSLQKSEGFLLCFTVIHPASASVS